MENEKSNKLIAEFMGMQLGHPDKNETRWKTNWFEKLIVDGNEFESGARHTHLLFNTSWDWLMPVVDKIESDDRYDVDILQYGTRITDNQKEIVNNIADISFDKKIEHTYDAVVEFIKNTEYKSCDRCCYDIVDDDGDIMEHICINNNFYSKPINK